MRLVIQRTKEASVVVDGEVVGSIGQGLFVLVGVEDGDTEADMEWLVQKTAGMRIFDDENGVMNRSVVDVGGGLLAVSQFTLTASTKKGNRPSYIRAAGHELLLRCMTNTAKGFLRCPAYRWKKVCSVRTCSALWSTTGL